MAVPLKKFGVKAVSGSATTVTVTFATDTQNETSPVAFPTGYTVIVPMPCPDWATSIKKGSATVTAVTFTFGTAAPTGGGNIDWEASGYKLT